jgi:FPC/CPF motif-containing protein YcgG
MSVEFSKHAVERLRQRFPERETLKSLVRLIAEKLDAYPFPCAPGTQKVIEGTVQFQAVRVIARALTARHFVIVTVMWNKKH